MSPCDRKILQELSEVLQLLLDGNPDEAIKLLDKITTEQDASPEIISHKDVLEHFLRQHKDGADFVTGLAEGNLDVVLPARNYVISHLKQLQSNLRHLTWQTQQIALGDYNQNVSFMGDFAVAFNKMIEALREKRRMEESLRELYETRDKLMSVISHDLKSPFNGILGFLNLLLQDYHELSDTDRIEYLTNIQDSALQAFKLVDNLLEWSRLQTGRIEFQFQRSNLHQMVFENFMLLKPSADQKQIQLYNLVPAGLFINADHNSIMTVLRNLINNAIKYTGHGGNVSVRVSNGDDQLLVSVADTGVGIKPENLALLFRTGSSVKTRGTDNEKGTGLGLLLCKEFIEKHGGRIWAESTAGTGSTFFFSVKPAGNIPLS